jgi:protein-S-isoprenylcysteine O-methyltransferase Ste14
VQLWVRSLVATVILPGSVAGLIPYWLLSDAFSDRVELGVIRWLGLLPFVAGLVVYAMTTWAFGAIGRGTPAPWDPPRTLVRTRLHAWVRNPMYIGVLLVIVGEAIVWQAPALLYYAALVAVLFHIRVITYEEPVLRRAFGPAFEAYCAQVSRWRPRRPA